MPLDDYDRPANADRSQPALGDWGAEPNAEPAELDYDPATVPVVYPIKLLWCWRCGESAEPVAGRCP